MNFHIRKFVIILIHMIFYSVVTAKIELKKGWTRPNAWQNNEGEESAGLSECVCSTEPNESLLDSNFDPTLIFYKKLLTNLFDRDSYSKDNTGLLQRAILFKFTESEFKLIEESLDPRDWDEFVTKVFQNAQTTNSFDKSSGYQSSNYFDNIFDNFEMTLNFPSWSSYFEVNIFTISIAVITILFLHRRHNYNLIALCLLVIVTAGFFKEYKVCNKELEIEKVVSLLDEVSENPCKGFDIQGTKIEIQGKPWYNFWSKPSKKDECVEHLRKQHKKMEDSSYCSPDEVFIRYIYNSYMKQLEMLVQKSIEIFKNLMKDIAFPWNIVAVGVFCLIMSTFLTLFFKYVIATFIQRIPSLQNEPTVVNQVQQENRNQNHHEQYHELLRLQNDSINQLTKVIATQPLLPLGSGVQIIETQNYMKSIEDLPAPIVQPNIIVKEENTVIINDMMSTLGKPTVMIEDETIIDKSENKENDSINNKENLPKNSKNDIDSIGPS